MFNNNSTDIAHNLMDSASQTADAALNATQRAANIALDGASHSLQTARRQIRTGAHQASERTVAYVREEPVKSLMIAAATGAVLMALAYVIGSPRHSR
jgi:ElaB/YqjD/DUF883 family membrane-anchored ribosome-binding protein